MKVKKRWIIVSIFVVIAAFAGGWFLSGRITSLMPPVEATIKQDEAQYGEEETKILETSQKFWSAMEQADEEGMRAIADPNSTFVHIGMTCKLDEEIGFYTSGTFQPTSIEFHDQTVDIFGDTAIVITDCDYALKMGASSTSHHFAVTEVYVNQADEWKLIQFSFTALVS